MSRRAVRSPRPSAIPLLATIAALAFATSLAFGSLRPERARLDAMRGERGVREAELLRVRADADALEIRWERIESDPYLVERAVRDEFHYARPGERIADAGE